MSKTSSLITRNIRLGLFVIIAVAFTVFMLWMIGSSRNLFSSNFEISSDFKTVNGLMIGNNVRLSGIDVGTVRRIEVTSDTTVRVTMIIEKRMRKFIRRNAIASVGTDGLMGSKLVNINSGKGPADPVKTGDVIPSLPPIESDEMLRTLNTTNLNLARITTDMKMVTQKLNSSKSLWSILQDTVVAENLKGTIANAREASIRIKSITRDVETLTAEARKGKGLAGTIFSDSLIAGKLRNTLDNISSAGSKIQSAADELHHMSVRFSEGKGTIDLLLVDTAFRSRLSESMMFIRSSAHKLDEDMDALRQNFLFRRYFRKQEKEAKKSSLK